jgi:hypothetical protein
MMQQPKDMTTATGRAETKLTAIFNAIGDTLSNLASPNAEQDGEDKEDDEADTDLGKLTDDDEPGWVMGTISKSVQHRRESFRPKQMRLDTMTQPGWGDTSNNFRGRDVKYGTAELNLPAVVKTKINMTAASASPTTTGEHTLTLDIVRGQLVMLAVTSRPGSTQTRLGFEKPQRIKLIPVLSPDAETDLTPIQDA